jgi:ATP-binding cassette subfamily B protein
MIAIPSKATQASPDAASSHIKTLPFNWGLISFRPLAYTLLFGCMFTFLAARIVPGLIEKAIFDTLSGDSMAGWSLWTLVALYVSAELARLTTLLGSGWYDVTFRVGVGALLRRNVMASILRRPGAVPIPISSGDAINRLGDDVGETSDFPTWFPHMAGHIFSSVIALLIMASINLTITVVIVIPMLLAIAASRVAWSHLLRGWHESRDAAGVITGFLGEILGAVQAVKVANAEDDVVGRFERLSDVRRRAELRQRFARGILYSLNDNIAIFGIGITILLAGRAMSAGTFTVGDFALFVYYLWFTADLPLQIGTFVGDYSTQAVSIRRLEALVEPEAGKGPGGTRGDLRSE